MEGLLITAKGSKELAGGRRLHLLVAIAYGKGVICAETYERMDDGPYFARFIRRQFPTLIDITGKQSNNTPKLFVMDNDLSQTSAVAKKASHSVVISRTNVASVGSVFNGTRKVKFLSLPETIKEKSTFRAKALRRELVVSHY